MRQDGSYEQRWIHRIDEVDVHAWDRLASDDPYARHGWLRALEESAADAADPAYLLVEEDGQLRGAAICYRSPRGGSRLLDELYFGRLGRHARRLGMSLHPALLCGPLFGQGRHLLWDRARADAPAVLGRLRDAVIRQAEAWRLNLAFVKVPADEPELINALSEGAGSRSLNWPVNYVDIRWKDFDEYVASLGSRRATVVRRERAAPRSARVDITRETQVARDAGALYALIEGNQRAYSDEPLGVGASFFSSLARHHPEGSVVNVARDQGKLLGAALMVVAGRRAGGPFIGLEDEPRNRKAFSYFNLSLYEPIHWCICHGVERLYLGAGLYDAKKRRGCEVMELAMFLRHRSGLGRLLCAGLSGLHRRWVLGKLRRQSVAITFASGS